MALSPEFSIYISLREIWPFIKEWVYRECQVLHQHVTLGYCNCGSKGFIHYVKKTFCKQTSLEMIERW